MDRMPPRLERMRTAEYDDYELSDHDSMVYVPPAIGYQSKQQHHPRQQQQQQQQEQQHHHKQQPPAMRRQHSVSFERGHSRRGPARAAGGDGPVHNVHHQLSYQLGSQTDMLTHSPPENSSDHLMSYMSPALRPSSSSSSTWRGNNVNI